MTDCKWWGCGCCEKRKVFGGKMRAGVRDQIRGVVERRNNR